MIFKEGLTVRGFTTAASIWVTAAIGILLGMVLKSRDRRNADTLSRTLSQLKEVLEFRIDPMGD